MIVGYLGAFEVFELENAFFVVFLIVTKLFLQIFLIELRNREVLNEFVTEVSKITGSKPQAKVGKLLSASSVN